MEVLDVGHILLGLSGVVATLVFLLAMLGAGTEDPRFIRAARNGFHVLFLVLAASAGCLVHAILRGEYNNNYIYNYSERLLPTFFKAAGLWAGMAGSLLYWTVLLGGFGAIVALQHRRSSPESAGRKLEPYVYLVLAAVTLFFIVVTSREKPFELIDFEKRLALAERHGIPMDEKGNLGDGFGLNPQLVTWWFVLHPPALYLGFIGWTVPFAFALAGLITGQMGTHWIRTVRRWSLVAWVFLTAGIIMGGLWAYRQLGWGGYWKWDAVENASLIPWLTGTAFLHSIVATERRNLFRAWSAFLLILTFFLTLVGTWMTRAGVVSSVHAFAGGEIGLWFQLFLFIVAGISAFLLAYRVRDLWGSDRLESVFSKETMIFLSSLALLALAAAVLFLSFLPKLSHDWLGRMVTDDDQGTSLYGMVTTPFFAFLLFLTAVGHGLGWVRTPWATLRRNLLGPGIATLVFMALLYVFLLSKGLTGTWKDVLIPRLKDSHPSAVYPTGLLIGLCFFLGAVVLFDLLRGLRAWLGVPGRNVLAGCLGFVRQNHRRIGGHLGHLGLAVITVGIVASSTFKIDKNLTLKKGDAAIVGPYRFAVADRKWRTAPIPGEPYQKDEVWLRITEAPSVPVAHGESASPTGTTGDSGPLVAEMRVERRYYPKRDDWIREVSIYRRLFEDIYVYFSAGDIEGNIHLAVHLNPLMYLLYLGWILMTLGALMAAVPMRRKAPSSAAEEGMEP